MIKANSKKKNDLSNVVFSLTYGVYDDKKRKDYFYTAILMTIILTFISVLCIVYSIIDYVKQEISIVKLIVGMIFGICGPTIFSCMLIGLAYRYHKLRKKILVWIEDAVQIEAYSKNIGTDYYWIGIQCIKLQVEFELSGIKIVRTTENEVRSFLFDFGRPVGCFPNISQYADKPINILYSPEYDQVLILKQ